MTVATRLRVSGFSVSKLPGLAVWLAADQLTGLADTDPVTSWPDASGNGRDAAQATGANKPAYRTAVLNGRPVVRFDGTNDRLATALFGAPLAQPTTLLVVAQLATTAATYVLVDGADCTDRQVLYANFGFWGIQAGGNSVSGAQDTAAHILCAEFGATDTLRVDGTQVLSADVGAGAMGGLRLGCWCDVSGGFLGGDIAEVAVYNRALSTVERDALERYLGNKYGIAVA